MSFNNFDGYSIPYIDEEDFESVFSNNILPSPPYFECEPMEEVQEKEIENKINFNQNAFTIEEESLQIYNKLQTIKDIIKNEEDINAKKVVYFEENDGKEIKTIEIENKEDKKDKKDEVEKIIIDEKPKNEANIIPIKNKKKQNIFRTYNSHDFNIFHPGGTGEYFKYIKCKIREESLNPKQKNEEFSQNHFLFNIFVKNKKQIFRRKPKEKKKRKDKPDNIRKKIKSRFLKLLKARINEILKNAKSEYFFDNLPQCFISNISKNGNRFILDMTFKEILTTNFFEDDTSNDNSNTTFTNKKRNPNKVKYDKNQEVLGYLEKNNNISKSSNFNVISKLTFRDIFKEYLKSEEFEKDILVLKNKNNSENYIKEYINKAESFLDYFSSEN